MDFIGFPKISRISRYCVITEKVDGTNAQIVIGEDGELLIGSRNRWITPEDDNFGFARWAYENREDLLKLGPGQHFGEWWGQGIQRRYELEEKRFSLFNTSRWNNETKPDCCHVVPILYEGPFLTSECQFSIDTIRETGSRAAPGFMNPEGIVIYHTAANIYFKKTVKNDEKRKSEVSKL